MLINTLAKFLIVAAIVSMGFAVYNVYNNQEAPIHKINKYKTITPTSRTLKQEIEVDAQVVPEKEIKVSPEISGKLEMLAVSEGDKVIAGQQLASIEHRELLAQLNQAKAKLEQARAELEKAKAGAREEDIILAKEAVSESKIALNSAKAELANVIRASSDFLDQKIGEIDVFFVEPDLENSISFTVKRVDNKTQDIITHSRYALNNPLNRIYSYSEQLKSFEEIADVDTQELIEYGAILSKLLADIKSMLNYMEAGAQDALEEWPNEISLSILQQKSQELRPGFEIEKQKVDMALSAVQLALSKYKQADAQLKKIEAGSREEDIRALEAALRVADAGVASIQAKLNKANIFAPASGTISQVYKEKGEFVSSLEPILSIITDGVFVKARVPEVDISKVKLGMPVEIKFDAYKSKRFKGEVYFIYPAQKEINNIVYYEIKILIKDPDAKNYEILPGMTASVFIPTVNKNAELSIPLSIVQRDDKGEFVNVLRKGAVNPFVPQKVYIKLGDKDNKYVEVLSGLSKTDKIVIGKE